MKRDADIFSEAYQRKTLKMLMIIGDRKPDISFISKFFEYCEAKYFDIDSRAQIYRVLQNDFNMSHVPMPIDILESRMTQQSNIKDSGIYQAELDSIRNVNIDYTSEIDYIKGHMENYVRLNYFVTQFREIAEDYNDKRYHEVMTKFKASSDKLSNISFANNDYVVIDDYKKIIESARESVKNPCITGLTAIDKEIGGLLPQTWTTFLGSSNVGKSMLTWSLARINAENGKKVVVSVHEDEEEPTKLRALSAFSGVSYNTLVSNVPLNAAEQASLQVAQDLLDKHVVMMFMYGRDATIEKVHERLQRIKQDRGVDLYICDYGQCLSSEAFKYRDNSYELQGYIYERLKHICLELKIAGAGSAQVNRQGNVVNKKGMDLLRTTDVGDSFIIVRKSSNIITMNRSDEDIKMNRIFYLLDKARQGRCPILVQSSTDYRSCTTIDLHGQIELDTIARPTAGYKKQVEE